MKIEQLTENIETLILFGESIFAERGIAAGGKIKIDLVDFYQFRASSLSFILKLFPDSHPYYTDFESKVDSAEPFKTRRGVGILKAIKNEITGGWLSNTKNLISADIFSDFLEMAEHLLDEGYKDPSAVLIGSALENHLKFLCDKFDVQVEFENQGRLIPKKADVINADLFRANAYSKLDQKNITALLDIRNNAAHGDFDKYNKDQVKLMLQSVREFITRTSRQTF